MKKACRILSLVSLFTFFAVMSAQAIPTVSLNILDGDITVGEGFNVEVWVYGDSIGEDLLVFGFDVNTAETHFSYDGYTIESGFFDGSDPFNLDNVSGWGNTSDDNVLLATLSFTGLIAGADDLQVQGPYDALFDGLVYELGGYDIDDTISITINPLGAPIPEPGTLLLLSCGLIGIAGVKKRIWKV